MKQTITSITLPASIVQQVLSAHLNAQCLRIPHTVTGVELLDDQFVIPLEPAPEPAPIVTTTAPTVWTYPDTATPTLPTNGNGNGHHADVGADLGVRPGPATTEEVTPAEAPKRHRISGLTDGIRAEVIRLYQIGGLTFHEIAQSTGIGYSTAFRVVKEWKKQQAVTADGAA